jgi:hypothetical protein
MGFYTRGSAGLGRDPVLSGRESASGGGDRSKQYIVETTGSGAAFLDYDNDGLLDVFLIRGVSWECAC